MAIVQLRNDTEGRAYYRRKGVVEIAPTDPNERVIDEIHAGRGDELHEPRDAAAISVRPFVMPIARCAAGCTS
jgi:hypothetical protein